ncbi:aldose epimerase [Delftia tsuruhatensis]|nr:aldose epimerase [Delftia tsuruhatensis]
MTEEGWAGERLYSSMKVTSSFPAVTALPAAAQAPGACADAWQGLPAIRLRLACGDAALVALQGAQLLSWQAGGEEQLFLSPHAAHDGHTPIRGGIPVCFPQFNQRGPLVKHGFARTLPWQADAAQAEVLAGDGLFLRLRLADTPQTRAVWPPSFETWLEVTLLPGRLDVELVVHNRGDTPLAFTAALHSYLRVADVEQCRLQGLDGLPYWDAVADTHPTQHGDVRFGEELDRVYPRPGNAMELAAPGGGLRISQDAAWTETVVWNPGPALCERLPDMPPQGWRQMLCVEAAAIDAPVHVAPGAQWRAAQRLHKL